jgi:hypothetical protein
VSEPGKMPHLRQGIKRGMQFLLRRKEPQVGMDYATHVFRKETNPVS